ncbi:MAG: OmpW family [Geminicoccaceae bacterium]|nr:OmpW family [Geminicoccaceae bacterium]
MRTIRRMLGVLILLLPLATVSARAQVWHSLTYQPAQPLSNTEDFTEGFTWRGAGYDLKKFLQPDLAVGLSLGWHVFDEQTDEVISAFGVDVSGDQFRYVNSWPILINATYFLGTPGRTRPFVTGHLGMYVMEHRIDVGLYSIRDTKVHFGLAPEAGVAFPVGGNLAAVLSGRYNYAFSANDIPQQSYVTVGIGLAWSK